jgi:hypothetical protein
MKYKITLFFIYGAISFDIEASDWQSAQLFGDQLVEMYKASYHNVDYIYESQT